MTNTLISHLPSRGGLGGVLKMYIKPSLKIESAQPAQMLAESLRINNEPDTQVHGNEALTRENVTCDDIDFWSDDEE